MAWTTNREPDLEDDLDLLISNLCTEWGFCNQLSAAELIADGGELSAARFAESVLEAEGMDPECETRWRRSISNVFQKRYGASTSLETYRQPSD